MDIGLGHTTGCDGEGSPYEGFFTGFGYNGICCLCEKQCYPEGTSDPGDMLDDFLTDTGYTAEPNIVTGLSIRLDGWTGPVSLPDSPDRRESAQIRFDLASYDEQRPKDKRRMVRSGLRGKSILDK